MRFCHNKCEYIVGTGKILAICQPPKRDVSVSYYGTSCNFGKQGITPKEMIEKKGKEGITL